MLFHIANSSISKAPLVRALLLDEQGDHLRPVVLRPKPLLYTRELLFPLSLRHRGARL